MGDLKKVPSFDDDFSILVRSIKRSSTNPLGGCSSANYCLRCCSMVVGITHVKVTFCECFKVLVRGTHTYFTWLF